MTSAAPDIDEDEKDAELVEAEEDAVELAHADEHDEEEEEDEDEEKNPAGEFSLVLVDESKPTVDGRYFVPDKVTWREPPIPLLFTTTNGNGHKGGEIGGAITKIWREDGKIKGSGHFESGEKGQELRRLITEGVLTGVSADVGGAMVELEAANKYGKEMQKITEGKILGVTALPLQAYDDTRIAVTAAAIPAAPPKSWFENPGLKKVTPISVTADGRVYGHVAAWGTCHVGFNRPGECLTPPHSASNYSHFTIGEVLTAEGDTVPTGPITLGTGHAGLTLNANAARDHYDNTGTAVADVTAGEDQHGIWVSGAMRPSVTDDKIREFRASAPSGDWRNIGGTLEMVGVLAVNVPGFPIPRAKVEFADEQPLALVAAGAVPVEEFDVETVQEFDAADEDCGCDGEKDDLDAKLAALESEIEELAAKMLAEGEFGRNYTIPNKKSSPKEIAGSHGHKPHGTSILWPAMYEELRKKGMTKEKAARISNAAWNKKHKAPGNKGPGRFSALIEEFHATHNQKSHGERKKGPGRAASRKAPVVEHPIANWGKDHPRGAEPGTPAGNRISNRAKAANIFREIEAAQKRERAAKKAHSAAPNRTGKHWTDTMAEMDDDWMMTSEERDDARNMEDRAYLEREFKAAKEAAKGVRKVRRTVKRSRGQQFTGEETLEMALDAVEEFRNTHAGRQNRDNHGRFAEHGGLGGLANKYKGPNKGKKLSKAARSGADTGSSGYKGVAKTVQEKDGSAREKAQWARKEKARPIGVAEISKEKAERRAKLEKAKARAAERSKGTSVATETPRAVFRRKGESDSEMAKRESNRRREAKELEAAKASQALASYKAKAKAQDTARKRMSTGRSAPDRSGSPKASPKPTQPVYRSVAEKVAERDGSAREKAAWSRKAKNIPLGKAEIAKEKADRKAKLEAAKARAAARSGK